MDPSNDASAMQIQSQGPVPWSTGLFDCFKDPAICCITCCCPCITFGHIAEIIDKGSPPCVQSGAVYALILAFTACSCLYSCFYRSKMREQYLLEEKPCIDCLAHWCCEPCALCQEYRELKNRGFDVPSGKISVAEIIVVLNLIFMFMIQLIKNGIIAG